MKNIRKIMVVAALCLMFVATTTLVSSCHIRLVEKDPVTWTKVVGGAYGAIDIDECKHKFVFKASNLVPKTSYTLVAYAEGWPSVTMVLGSGTSYKGGYLCIKGSIPVLPMYTYISGEYACQTGAKIWLVHTADLFGMNLVWAPQGWLWETKLYKN